MTKILLFSLPVLIAILVLGGINTASAVSTVTCEGTPFEYESHDSIYEESGRYFCDDRYGFPTTFFTCTDTSHPLHGQTADFSQITEAKISKDKVKGKIGVLMQADTENDGNIDFEKQFRGKISGTSNCNLGICILTIDVFASSERVSLQMNQVVTIDTIIGEVTSTQIPHTVIEFTSAK